MRERVPSGNIARTRFFLSLSFAALSIFMRDILLSLSTSMSSGRLIASPKNGTSKSAFFATHVRSLLVDVSRTPISRSL